MQREIARNLLKHGIPVEVVVESTGLSHEEVEALKASTDVG